MSDSTQPHQNAQPLQNQVGLFNLANSLTIFRLVIVPFFVFALFHDHGASTHWRYIATGLFVIAGFTDRVDGQLARNRNTITDFGTFLDPIADKALIGSALIGLSQLGELAWWVTVVILTREVGITAMRLMVIRKRVIPANRGGKAKTLIQGFAILFYLVPFPASLEPERKALMFLAVAITVITGLDYLKDVLRRAD